MKHILYKKGDPDAPDVIRDRNGDVVLQMCKYCRKAESELVGECTATHPQTSAEREAMLRNLPED